MSNELVNQNTLNSQNSEWNDSNGFDALDALFSEARQTQPNLVDNNLNKIVLNSLPANPKRHQRRSWMFDCIGMIFGVIACYFFFDLSSVANALLGLVPESFSLTVANIGALAGALMAALAGAAVLAWWTTEKAIQ